MPIDASAIADQLLLGRYRVLEERGKGGFGTVNVCWDPRLMRRVAIKTIPLHVAAPPQRGRKNTAAAEAEALAELRRHDMLLRAALAETRTASMLAHPNIVAMLDFESDDENAYIIMEYVEGASLAELLDATEDGLLTADEAAAVVEGVCDALQFAHDNGVLHLDIKPDNILIEMSGRVRLADFGMAALSSATGYAGARGGTVGYMPPEQIEGEDVDVRTDVFAFASVMYEALTGVRPFAAATMQESLELVERGVADPCALNETVMPQAADALLVALNPNPLVRPSSAEGFGDEILAGLGRPKVGRKSLAAFVADVLDDSEPALIDGNNEETCEYDGAFTCPEFYELGALSRTFPHLTAHELRGVAGIVCAIISANAVSTLVPSVGATPSPAAIAAFAVALALGCLAPQLGSAIALAAVAVAAFASAQWLLGSLVVIGGIVWWILVARLRPLGSAATLLGPWGALIDGWLLPAGPAALSATVGALVYGTLSQVAWDIPLTLSGWIASAGWVAGAAAAGALCHNGTKGRCYLGIFCGCALVLGFGFTAQRMENGGSWTTLPSEALAMMMGSTILAFLCVFLLGTPRALNVDRADADWDLDTQERGVAG